MDLNTIFNAIFLCFLNALFMAAGIFLNSVVIICLRKSSRLRKNQGYFMILVLSCVDLFLLSIFHPTLFIWTIFWSLQTSVINQYGDMIDMWVSKAGIIWGLSLFALLTLNIERFLAIKYPFFHQTAITKRRLLLLLAFLMTFTVSVFTLVHFYWKSQHDIVVVAFATLVLLVFIYLNCNMLIIAKSKREKAKVVAMATSIDKESKKSKYNFRNISSCSLLVGCVFVCYSPEIAYSVLYSTDMLPNGRQAWLFHIWSCTFWAMNSTLNCLIFFWRNSILRREGNKIVQCCRFARSWN